MTIHIDKPLVYSVCFVSWFDNERHFVKVTVHPGKQLGDELALIEPFYQDCLVYSIAFVNQLDFSTGKK